MAVVTRFLDAANHHDADTLYASVHPAFESFQPLHPDRNFRGPGQLISNWKAIFDAEPGFRLTVLRASTTGNTVWVELHGAGDSSEAAGIFIVGVENGRIRWVRVYSDLVESVAEQEPAEGTPSVGPTATEPSSAAAEPDAAARFADDAPMFRPAVAADSPTVEHEGGDSEAAPTGALRLVEPSDQPVPETGIASESPDPGLRLVDRSAASSEVGDGSEADAGPVETLVGPSRTVSATPGATWPPESSPTEAVPGDSVPTESRGPTASPPRPTETLCWCR